MSEHTKAKPVLKNRWLLHLLEGGSVGIILSSIDYSNLNNRSIAILIACGMLIFSWLIRYKFK